MENTDIFTEMLRGLEERAHAIVVQNRALLTRLESLGFNPVKELDFTANNAGVLIHRLFEAIARFDEGKVPFSVLAELCSTTDTLIDELKKRDDAPVCELDAAGVAFRAASIIWKDNHPEPLMQKETYLKKHFDAEAEIKKALNVLHAAYVKKYTAKGRKRKTLSAADMLEDDGKKAGERRVVFAEIARLSSLGYSIAKAIETMKSGSYGSRMRGVKSETWRRYYTEYMRRKALRKRAKALGREPIKAVGEPINEPIKAISEPINQGGEPIKCGTDAAVLRKIGHNPGINRIKLMKDVGLSRSTVSRSLVRLIDDGCIVYCGSKKTGGYYANS